MLHCTMDSATLTRLRLDDLLTDLVHARRNGDSAGSRCWPTARYDAGRARPARVIWPSMPPAS